LKTSVIIPTYYRSDELFRLLRNLLEQLVKPEEVLVIDDTPTNEIRNVCEKYAVEFNKVGIALLYVKNPGERSISVARNLGAKMAKGEYFLFIDSDVTLYPDYVEKILDTFKKYPEVLGVGGWDKQFMYHQIPSGIRYHSKQVFNKLFLNWRFSIDSCKNFEVPSILSRTVYCEYINGQSISVKSSVLNEF
jgi:GT2 family glycosyltransferase